VHSDIPNLSAPPPTRVSADYIHKITHVLVQKKHTNCYRQALY